MTTLLALLSSSHSNFLPIFRLLLTSHVDADGVSERSMPTRVSLQCSDFLPGGHAVPSRKYKLLRRMLHIQHMDFEYALWQMLYLCTQPSRVYVCM